MMSPYDMPTYMGQAIFCYEDGTWDEKFFVSVGATEEGMRQLIKDEAEGVQWFFIVEILLEDDPYWEDYIKAGVVSELL